jgi:hypothetical protein
MTFQFIRLLEIKIHQVILLLLIFTDGDLGYRMMPALIYAAEEGQIQITEVLINAGANINKKSNCDAVTL